MENPLQQGSCQISIGGELALVWLCGYRDLHLLSYRIAITPLYPGLRRFKKGRGFSQWTGNDSKALMKVPLLPIKYVVY